MTPTSSTILSNYLCGLAYILLYFDGRLRLPGLQTLVTQNNSNNRNRTISGALYTFSPTCLLSIFLRRYWRCDPRPSDTACKWCRYPSEKASAPSLPGWNLYLYSPWQRAGYFVAAVSKADEVPSDPQRHLKGRGALCGSFIHLHDPPYTPQTARDRP